MDIKLDITPFLVVIDATKAATFYEAAFDAIILEKYTNNGRTNARVRIGNADFWIGDEEPEFDNLSPTTIGGSAVRMILTTPDPDTIFAKALKAGATQICPVTVEEDWKIGKLKDPFGHIWEIGCPHSESIS
ncbi:VOC family protein [Dyadobacter sp. Leaf189]|uniref:VOC family protein n=1 Tax=Dyadobacter sp. Leaf189 TaxID=1736295 RepID=UPI0006F8BB20|nr:VOC family protein [Dyadobacter sp. Leaf189]KQS27121.1 glyoxalase [Dyadobacter sp. Leaf189]